MIQLINEIQCNLDLQVTLFASVSQDEQKF